MIFHFCSLHKCVTIARKTALYLSPHAVLYHLHISRKSWWMINNESGIHSQFNKHTSLQSCYPSLSTCTPIICLTVSDPCLPYTYPPPGGGGGGTMLFGRGCAAEAAKPVPIFKGHFGGKGYPLLGVWRKRVPIIRGFYSRKLCFCVL